MAFEQFAQELDTEGQLDFTLPVYCNDGESIVTAAAVFVEATSTTPSVDPGPTMVTASFGVIAGNRWGVTAWVNGNSAPAGLYYLRFHGQTDSIPPRIFDKTKIIRVRQQ